MCYIFSCCGWALDFLQRAITFILACVLCCVISIGIIVAISAGVAYGYNYSMAEFLTFTRHNTTIYMRRGQFYNSPDFDPSKEVIYSRRSGFDSEMEQDHGSNSYNDNPADVVIHDTRQYAEILTKYSRTPKIKKLSESKESTVAPPVKWVPITPPNPRIEDTMINEDGSFPIVIRTFNDLATPETLTGLMGSETEETLRMNSESREFFEGMQYRPTISDKSDQLPNVRSRTTIIDEERLDLDIPAYPGSVYGDLENNDDENTIVKAF